MAGSKNPASLFYWNDWDNAPDLRSCSLAAQGLWMRCLCIAARSPEPGFILVPGQPSGRQDLAAVLSAQVGKPPEMLAPLIDELIASGTASVDRKGRVYCRRMVKAAALSQKRSESGKKGADVTHGKQNGNDDLPQQTGGKSVGKAPDKPPASSRLPASQLPPSALQNDLADFEAWYCAYPKRVGRGNALKAYRAARKKADAATLLAGAERAARQYASTDPQFVPYPASWLNQERWLDEAPTASPSKPEQGQPATDPWEQRVRGYREALDAGRAHPFWSGFWGPKPDERGCDAPAELLERYGFGRKAA